MRAFLASWLIYLIGNLEVWGLTPVQIITQPLFCQPSKSISNQFESFQLALANALRYFPPETHAELAPEFAQVSML